MSKNLIKTNYCLQCEDDAKKIAELERKLAEQQAYIYRLCGVIDICHVALMDGDIRSTKAAIATINSPYPVHSTEELNNLLAKAKEAGLAAAPKPQGECDE